MITCKSILFFPKAKAFDIGVLRYPISLDEIRLLMINRITNLKAKHTTMEDAFINLPNVSSNRNANTVSNKPVPLQIGKSFNSSNQSARLPEMEKISNKTRTRTATKRNEPKVIMQTEQKDRRRRNRSNSNDSLTDKRTKYDTGSNEFNSVTDLKFSASETMLKSSAYMLYTFTYSIFSSEIGQSFKIILDNVLSTIVKKTNSSNRYAFNTTKVTPTKVKEYFNRVTNLFALFIQTQTFGSVSTIPMPGSVTQNYATEIVASKFYVTDPVPNIKYVKQSMEDLFLPSNFQKLMMWFQQPFTTNAMGYGTVIAFTNSTAYTNVITVTASNASLASKTITTIPVNFDKRAFGQYMYKESEAIKALDVHDSFVSSGLYNNQTLNVDFKPDKKPVFSPVKWTLSTYMPFVKTTWANSVNTRDRRDIDASSELDMHPSVTNNLWWLSLISFNVGQDNTSGIVQPAVLDSTASSGTTDHTEITAIYPWLTKDVLENKLRDDNGDKFTTFNYTISNQYYSTVNDINEEDQNFVNLYKVSDRNKVSTISPFIKADQEDDRASISNKKTFFGTTLDYLKNPDFVTSNINVTENLLMELALSTLNDIIKF